MHIEFIRVIRIIHGCTLFFHCQIVIILIAICLLISTVLTDKYLLNWEIVLRRLFLCILMQMVVLFFRNMLNSSITTNTDYSSLYSKLIVTTSVSGKPDANGNLLIGNVDSRVPIAFRTDMTTKQIRYYFMTHVGGGAWHIIITTNSSGLLYITDTVITGTCYWLRIA